jgi:hypothetical protein
MIEFKNTKHLIEVMDFAIKVGAMDKLLDKLRYLAEYGNGEVDNICELHNDWAPHSFEFVMKHPDGTRWFPGGLIYSGPGQPLDGSAPALTVGIGIDSSVHGWSVHT